MSERRNRTTPLREEMDNARQPHLGVGPCRIPFFAQFGLRGSSGHTPTIWSACHELEDTIASTSRPDTVAALVLAKCPHIPWPSRGGVRHFQNATTHPGFTTQDHVEQKASTAQLYVGQCLLLGQQPADDGARSVSEHMHFRPCSVRRTGCCSHPSMPFETAFHPGCSLVQMFHFLPAQLRVPKRPQCQIQLPMASKLKTNQKRRSKWGSHTSGHCLREDASGLSRRLAGEPLGS